MLVSQEETSLDERVQLLQGRLGRELTAKEKFYIALSEACIGLQRQPTWDSFLKTNTR